MEQIKALLFRGETHEAIRLLDEHLATHPTSDEALYLRGNAYRKLNNFPQALNNYLAAMELNPDSPAHQAHDMLVKILNFYNKDMFNH